MTKTISCLIVFLALAASAYAQGPPFPKGDNGESSPPSPKTAKLAAGSKVDGLELPPDYTVAGDEGFVTLQAKTKGSVKWLVISGVKVKYISIPDNSIIVSVPPTGGLITVFAVAVVDGKLTDFARTNITVTTGPPGPNPPNPNPPNPNPPNPNPPNPNPPVTTALHVTFFVDLNNTTAEIAGILNSQQLRNAITAKGNFFRYYDIKSPIVAQKKLEGAIQKAGGSFVIIVQRSDGAVIMAEVMPRTEQEVAALLQKVGGL